MNDYRYDRIMKCLKKIKKLIKTSNSKQEAMMAKIDDINTLITEMNSATNDVAARIEALMSQLQGGVSPAEADAIIASLQGEVDRLHALASDPNDPIPA